MELAARDYQVKSKEMIKNEYRVGNKKVLLWLATGAGKTFVFCDLVKDSIARRKRCAIVVRGRKLVDQASQRLAREGVAHGVLMAGHWNFRPQLPVQVCSIDTLIAREIYPEFDFIILDEVHLATSPGYVDWLSHYPDAYILGVTATPWVDKSLEHAADSIVHPITMKDLVDRGYLVPFRCFAPSSPDMKGVKTVSGDFQNAQSEAAMSKGNLTGKIIEHWLKLANNRPTILFAVNIRHSKLLVGRFLDAGVMAEHCEAETKDAERSAMIARLESGATKVICNVGILCTGVDIPSCGCIIMARPTKSKNLFIQQAGRGTRLFDGKQNCLLLDHAGNVLRHGLPTDEDEEVDLSGKNRQKAITDVKTCSICFLAYVGIGCPECGPQEKDSSSKSLAESDEELVEVVYKVPRGAFKNSRFGKKKRAFEVAPAQGFLAAFPSRGKNE